MSEKYHGAIGNIFGKCFEFILSEKFIPATQSMGQRTSLLIAAICFSPVRWTSRSGFGSGSSRLPKALRRVSTNWMQWQENLPMSFSTKCCGTNRFSYGRSS